MGNLYRLNSLYEKELKTYPNLNSFSNATLKRAEIFEYLFLFLSNPSDHVLFHSEVNTDLLDYWKSLGFEFGSAHVCRDHHSTKVINLNPTMQFDNLIEWGKTFLLKNNTLIKNESLIMKGKLQNSKIEQTIWKINSLSLPFTIFLCKSFEEIQKKSLPMKFPLVIKSEFSFSGSGNLLIFNADDLILKRNQIQNLIRENKNGLILEEWKKEFIQKDFSSLYQIENNICNFLASTEMIIDSNGKFCGSKIISESNDFSEQQTKILQKFLKTNNWNYSGSVSIDGFSFLEDGKIQFQYFSEINFRFTMGRILFEIQKKLELQDKKVSLLFLEEKRLSEILSSIDKSKSKLIYLSPFDSKIKFRICLLII